MYVEPFPEDLKGRLKRHPRLYSVSRSLVNALGVPKSRISFRRDFKQFSQSALREDPRFSVDWADRHPCFGEDTVSMGFDRHYVYHTAWAARVLATTKPAFHADISSSLYFAAIASAFVPVKYYEFRAVPIQLSDLTSDAASLTELPFANQSVSSMSCMHAIEHVGLGRYGDPIDPLGDLQALGELQRVLAPGGNLLVVVPVGRARVCFNAHRVYSHAQIVAALPELTLTEFALIPDSDETGGLMVNPPAELVERQEYGCGCFWFTRAGLQTDAR